MTKNDQKLSRNDILVLKRSDLSWIYKKMSYFKTNGFSHLPNLNFYQSVKTQSKRNELEGKNPNTTQLPTTESQAVKKANNTK